MNAGSRAFRQALLWAGLLGVALRFAPQCSVNSSPQELVCLRLLSSVSRLGSSFPCMGTFPWVSSLTGGTGPLERYSCRYRWTSACCTCRNKAVTRVRVRRSSSIRTRSRNMWSNWSPKPTEGRRTESGSCRTVLGQFGCGADRSVRQSAHFYERKRPRPLRLFQLLAMTATRSVAGGSARRRLIRSVRENLLHR